MYGRDRSLKIKMGILSGAAARTGKYKRKNK